MKVYRCEKCSYQFCAGDSKSRDEFKCGAIVDYIAADDPTVGGDGIIQSAGMKPLGCGGKIVEITLEEAMADVQRE